MEFGLFGVQAYNDGRNEAFEEFLPCDFVNSFLVGDLEDCKAEATKRSMQRIHEAGKKCYLYFAHMTFISAISAGIIDVGESVQQGPRTVKREGWKERLQELYDWLSKEEYYASVEGFYIDEPFLCGICGKDFEEVTGEISRIFKNKRIFCCFSIAGVAPDIWTLDGIEQVNETTGQYITDAAFDMYHPFDEKYAYITSEMKRRLGNRDNLRIWHIPCVMNYRGDKEEQHAVDHINGLYDLLKTEKNPGGLMCYTYFASVGETEAIGNIPLEQLRGRGEKDKNWKLLWNTIVSIGKEICNN